MAALVPEAGSHKIIFRYEPVSVRIGLFLSLIFGTAMGLGIRGRVRSPLPIKTKRELGIKFPRVQKKRSSRKPFRGKKSKA
jgi:hypothetical protein